ncbi:MAG: efflux RND transporter periplasmic adaptor subunit [Magnetococcales bacterium]|nr:efflux RND transporter periplasmic adaptor subunit [Magnetococcales bacterium]
MVRFVVLGGFICVVAFGGRDGFAASTVPDQVSAPGVTQALRDIKLSMTVVGRIENLLVKEGHRVRQGDLLLHLDRRLEDLEVQRRKLLLADTARLNDLREKEKTLSSQVRSLRNLSGSGGVSRKQLEDEEIALGAIISERKSLEIAKLREQVELDSATEAFERRHLRSPMDGVVTKVLLHVGESVAANEPVMHLVDVSRVRFMGTVPAQVGAELREDRKVTIKLDLNDQNEKPLVRQAVVVFVSPITDAASGLVEVIAEFDNPDGSVKPGISGRMMF